MKLIASMGILALGTMGSLHAKGSLQSDQLGFVQAPGAGSQTLAIAEVPSLVRHAAEVALRSYETEVNFLGATLDFDEIEAVYEVTARTQDGRQIEIDISPQAQVLEIEQEISRTEVPLPVLETLRTMVPNYQAADESPLIEKSIRPASNGLLEVWYEFAGINYDVEIRSDARAVLLEMP